METLKKRWGSLLLAKNQGLGALRLRASIIICQMSSLDLDIESSSVHYTPQSSVPSQEVLTQTCTEPTGIGH